MRGGWKAHRVKLSGALLENFLIKPYNTPSRWSTSETRISCSLPAFTSDLCRVFCLSRFNPRRRIACYLFNFVNAQLHSFFLARITKLVDEPNDLSFFFKHDSSSRSSSAVVSPCTINTYFYNGDAVCEWQQVLKTASCQTITLFHVDMSHNGYSYIIACC